MQKLAPRRRQDLQPGRHVIRAIVGNDEARMHHVMERTGSACPANPFPVSVTNHSQPSSAPSARSTRHQCSLRTSATIGRKRGRHAKPTDAVPHKQRSDGSWGRPHPRPCSDASQFFQ